MKIRPLIASSVIIIVIILNSPSSQSPASQAAQTDAKPIAAEASAAPPSTGRAPNSPLTVEQTSASNVYPAFAIYPYSASGESLVYIPDSAAPGTWDYIKSVPSGNTYYAGDFVGGDYDRLYVLSKNNYELHTLDTTTVTDTLIGASVPISGQVWAGATGSSAGVLYASSMGETTSHLYTINTATGAATVVGEITNAPCTVDIAINANGAMYGLDICSDVLVQIDPATGAGTVLGSIGFDAIYAQGMDFGPDGVLYLAAFRNSSYVDPWGELRIADTTTGNSTPVDRFPDGEEVVVLAFAEPMSQPAQIVQNPSFEDGWAHWEIYNSPMLSGAASRSGTLSVNFFGEEEGIWQQVTVPADATYATLGYWIYGTSQETDFDQDLLCWSLWDQTAQTKYSEDYCFDLEYFNYDPLVWKHRVVTLPENVLESIAGQTVTLVFNQTQEDWGQYALESNVFVDDVFFSVYLPPSPLVTGVTPSSGSNDKTVHITNLAGDFFRAGASVQLTKDGQASINAANVYVLDETQIACDLDLTGAATGQWDVVVTNSGGTSGTLPNGFTVTDPFPTITSITPASGVNSGVVHVTNLAGSNFQAGASVKLTRSGQADINASSVNVVNGNQITCDLDLTGAATGQWDVEVTNPDAQSGALPNGFSVGSKIWNGSLSSDWHTAANWTPSGAPASSDDVHIPDVTNDPLISNGNAAVNSLLINAGAVLDLTDRALTVQDTLTNNGTLKQTLDVITGNTTNFLRITNLAGTQTRYYGLDITPSEITFTTEGPETAQVSGASASIAQAPALAGSKVEPLVPIMLLPNGAPAFGAQVKNADLVSFDTDTPATLNVIANIGGAYFAGDFLDGDFSKMYAIDDSTDTFVSINTATAAITAIGTASPSGDHYWTGMAGDPTDGVMYASSTNNSASMLYTLDVSTGAPTVVGTVTNAPLIAGIAINAAGEMYGLDLVNAVLVSIDKATGAGTVIGSVGFVANYAQGMDFDETADVLYLAAYISTTNTAELRIADTTTGATTLVGSFPAATEIDALSIATGGNTPPVAVNDAYTTTQDIPLNVAAPGVLDNDIDGDSLTALLDTGPAHGALSLNADGSFTYTPTAGFDGADSFTYHANDGVSGSNIATVTINVTTAASTPPTLSGLPDQNVPLDSSRDNAIDLWSYASDAQDADSDLNFAIINSPAASAGVSLDSNRYIDINPLAGWTGVTDVEVQVQDTDGLTATDSFQVNVVSGSDISSVTVSVSGNQLCPGRFTGVKRCFDITPVAALTATVQFYFSEAERNGQVLDDLLALHYDGEWTEEPGPYTRDGAGDAQYVRAENVDDLALFALDWFNGHHAVFVPLVQRQYSP